MPRPMPSEAKRSFMNNRSLKRRTAAVVLCCGVWLVLPSGEALGQLTPDREYFGVSRPIPMRVAAPAGKVGDLRIELYSAGDATPVAAAPIDKGGVDLSALFPSLWAAPGTKIQYAQLVVGEEKVGPAVVLVPMRNPMAAVLYSEQQKTVWYNDPQTGVPSFKPREGQVAWVSNETATFTGLRAYTDKHVVLTTTEGEIEFRLRPDEAPNTVCNFRQLVQGGFYTDIIFHRIVPQLATGAPFVIQVGDPTGTGDGGPGYSIDLEPSRLPHDFGVISMAREVEPNTNGSQVFVCLSREGTRSLDGRYTAFGEAVSGAEVITAIAAAPLIPDAPGQDPKNRPKDPPVLLSARLVDAPPYGTGPRPVTRPPEPPKSR